MIPPFPSFKKLELSDKEEVESHTNQFPPYSDYNFASMFGYDTEGRSELSLLNGNLVVVFTDYLTNKPFYSFLGHQQPITTAKQLLNETRKNNFLPFLKLIPQASVTKELLEEPSLTLTEDRDNFDYILSARDLATLASSDYYPKRKQLAIFEQKHPGKTISMLDLENKEIHQAILSVIIEWQKKQNKSDEEVKTEITAITRTLNHISELDAYGLGVYVENKLIGFVIADLANKNFAEFHFMKGDTNYKGIYAALHCYMAQKLVLKNYSFINIEQDLGIPGLRDAKKQWHPIELLKKYKISLNYQGSDL